VTIIIFPFCLLLFVLYLPFLSAKSHSHGTTKGKKNPGQDEAYGSQGLTEATGAETPVYAYEIYLRCLDTTHRRTS
jgi:hypothetical protein